MGSAVIRAIRSNASNIGLEKIPLRSGVLQARHCRSVNLTVVVVGLVELDDHVPLFFVVANTGNVTVLVHIRAGECIQ